MAFLRYYLYFPVFFWSITVYSQSAQVIGTGAEKFYILDSNSYLRRQPYMTVCDSLLKEEKKAELAGDNELAGSLRLFLYIKAYTDQVSGYDTTEYHFLQLASEAEVENSKRLRANVMQSLGNFYVKNQQLSAGIEQYLTAYSIYKNFRSAEFPYKNYYTYILGLNLYRYQDYRQAIGYLHEALYAEQNNFSYGSANAIALSYRNMKKYDSAIIYFRAIYDTAVLHNSISWMGITQGNLGITYYLQKEYAKAEPLLKKDIETSQASGNEIKNAVNSMTVLADIYFEQNKYYESEKLLYQALSLSHGKKFWSDYDLAEKLYEQLYRLNVARKNYRVSSIYADSAILALDSSVSRKEATNLARAYDKQEYIKKKLAAEKQKLGQIEEDKKQLYQQQQLYIFLIGFLFVLLLVAVMVNRYRNNLKIISTDLNDAPEIVVQKMSIVIISIATCVAALVWAILYYYYYGLRPVTFGPLIYLVIVGPCLIIYFFTKNQKFLVNVQLVCIFALPIVAELSGGGFQSGVVINWALLAPVGALMYKGIRPAAYWMVLLVIAVICAIVFNGYFSKFYFPISDAARSMFYGMNLLGPSIIIYFSMQFFVKSVIKNGILLQEKNSQLSNTLGELGLEKQKSDDLLLNILPEEVAEELKLKGTTTARHFDNVTVMFTDFVNFTNAGERMTPQGLVDELHTCFKAFDEICGKYNIEKIKTVGDAYMAVAGLPTADQEHAVSMVIAAIEINRYMQDRKAILGDRTFGIRIGIHSGSVVAGIVGVKKFAYDIWGDTVNTAARMEQNSEAARINISQTTYELLKDRVECEYRGEVDAKGKGQLKMYFVLDTTAPVQGEPSILLIQQ